ncbi:hypothetical protein ruthe_02474 [Rubellimicrobium thermophilum DSM 16684]|uniref:4Fe-4S ferredoxin-type domain-containing protein n=1 Tax=Rubellimicrobium thermophilum DSM 16684 TaxID=1123069 RepID=S9QXE6_9RHOB|nr:hypothetical protein [Rubellimicrobium thermophilum]EPX84262.1 hypothetical protein ruthe_02474 [Rubellimicrobium thermophilum DSM 16684]
MDPLPALADRAARAGLFLSGIAPLRPEDGMPPRFRSVALLSPQEPDFWPLFRASPEAQDGQPDPLDRWSRRVIGRIACALGLKAVFPFGGPPYRPFLAWALRSGRCWSSPATLLVHETAGLWISFRGGILLGTEAPPVAARRPCDGCPAPCLAACPPRALTASGYDLPACHAFLDSPPGQACMTQGCRVRAACPVGASRRMPDQSAFHMRAFHA